MNHPINCNTCMHNGLWKGLGTHRIDHKGKEVKVPICTHRNGNIREIEDQRQKPGWCPGYLWSGKSGKKEKEPAPLRLTLKESLYLAGLMK